MRIKRSFLHMDSDQEYVFTHEQDYEQEKQNFSETHQEEFLKVGSQNNISYQNTVTSLPTQHFNSTIDEMSNEELVNQYENQFTREDVFKDNIEKPYLVQKSSNYSSDQQKSTMESEGQYTKEPVQLSELNSESISKLVEIEDFRPSNNIQQSNSKQKKAKNSLAKNHEQNKSIKQQKPKNKKPSYKNQKKFNESEIERLQQKKHVSHNLIKTVCQKLTSILCQVKDYRYNKQNLVLSYFDNNMQNIIDLHSKMESLKIFNFSIFHEILWENFFLSHLLTEQFRKFFNEYFLVTAYIQQWCIDQYFQEYLFFLPQLKKIGLSEDLVSKFSYVPYDLDKLSNYQDQTVKIQQLKEEEQEQEEQKLEHQFYDLSLNSNKEAKQEESSDFNSNFAYRSISSQNELFSYQIGRSEQDQQYEYLIYQQNNDEAQEFAEAQQVPPYFLNQEFQYPPPIQIECVPFLQGTQSCTNYLSVDPCPEDFLTHQCEENFFCLQDYHIANDPYQNQQQYWFPLQVESLYLQPDDFEEKIEIED